MRVLLMNHFPLQGSGSGVYTVNIARALVRKGHEVCIIMPENEVLAELDVDGIRLHPVYFDSCSADALDFDFPCFTTHPRSVMTFYELNNAQVAAYEGAFRAAIEDEIAAFVCRCHPLRAHLAAGKLRGRLRHTAHHHRTWYRPHRIPEIGALSRAGAQGLRHRRCHHHHLEGQHRARQQAVWRTGKGASRAQRL